MIVFYKIMYFTPPVGLQKLKGTWEKELNITTEDCRVEGCLETCEINFSLQSYQSNTVKDYTQNAHIP